MSSPIKDVMAFLHRALANISPERNSEFETTYAHFTLEYLDTPKWVCCVDPKTRRHISLSRRVVEVMWCASYAYMVLYMKEIQGKEITSPKEIDLHKDLEIDQGMKVLKWAYENWINGEDKPWPADLPQPVSAPETGSFLQVANELCLCSMAFILHHELAHIRLGHDPSARDLDDERQADYSAAEWIMQSSLREDDPMFIKRALGIAIALEVLTSWGIYTKNFGGNTHPPSYDRMIHTLRRFAHDNNHVVWAVVVAALKLHLDNAKLQTPDVRYDSFLECAEDFANVLANEKTK